MILIGLRKGIFAGAMVELLTRFNPPCFNPLFPTKPLNLAKNPCRRFIKIQSFWVGRSSMASNRSYCSSIVGAARASRTARSEAQDVLFDYLHCTRNLDFNDAEHMSKNSPLFVQFLLSKVQDESEISRSLARFLRYNPINEFEPFFESMGLRPLEVESSLPRDLMFLEDDVVLLMNFHVLCNYGFPRSKIGKLYVEAMEVFRYGKGVLASKLRNYEELGIGKPTVIRLVTSCPSLLIGGVDKDLVCVLERLNGLGIQYDWISAQLSDESTYSWSRMIDLIRFLDQMGCGEKDLSGLIETHPRFLFEDSGKKIYLVVAILLKIGLKMDKILILILKYPQILAGRFAKNLWQAVNFLAEIGMETEFIAKIVYSRMQILGSCSLKKPGYVLSRLSVSPDKLRDMIKEDPDKLTSLRELLKAGMSKKAAKEEGSHHVEKTAFLLSIGFVENSEEMLKAVKQFRGRGDQLQERFDCLVNAGLDCHVVANMIKAAPPVLNQSKDVLEMKIKCLVNDSGYPVQSLEAFPTYLCYEIEKIRRRFAMHKWLREKGVVKQMFALSTILACSEARFVKYFVNIHPKGPAEWERLKKLSSLD
ncbi:hypothetical protein Syun_002197 [Stephania yunnanensis]|uniref:Transcription termination factor MTEF18, mitochondrial-like n=1 Tax=Stephania yunnanensis TaxID=152371 RepID=A0AAP0LH42_9MAGN